MPEHFTIKKIISYTGVLFLKIITFAIVANNQLDSITCFALCGYKGYSMYRMDKTLPLIWIVLSYTIWKCCWNTISLQVSYIRANADLPKVEEITDQKRFEHLLSNHERLLHEKYPDYKHLLSSDILGSNRDNNINIIEVYSLVKKECGRKGQSNENLHNLQKELKNILRKEFFQLETLRNLLNQSKENITKLHIQMNLICKALESYPSHCEKVDI